MGIPNLLKKFLKELEIVRRILVAIISVCLTFQFPNTHGTGCILSSAIACNLADGKSLGESIKNAKSYLTGALRAGLDLGEGSGPLEHTYCI